MSETKVYFVLQIPHGGVLSTWWTESEAVAAVRAQVDALIREYGPHNRRVRDDERPVRLVLEHRLAGGSWETEFIFCVEGQVVQGSAVDRLAQLARS